MSLTPQEKAIKQTVKGMELTDWAEFMHNPSFNKQTQSKGTLSKGVFLDALAVIKSLKMARGLEIEPSKVLQRGNDLPDL